MPYPDRHAYPDRYAYPDRFYPVVDSVAWVARLTRLGVGTIQLRAKNLDDADALKIVREALDVTKGTGTKLVVNDYWRLALAAGCDFVHLGQGDLDGADIPALRRAGVRLGISTHDESELERALALRPAYVALGPIYPTLLKVMPWRPQGLARIGEWRRRIGSLPLIAIGGLTAERLPGVFAAGADVAAVVTDIVRAPDPDARVRQWLAVAEAAGEPASASGRRERA